VAEVVYASLAPTELIRLAHNRIGPRSARETRRARVEHRRKTHPLRLRAAEGLELPAPAMA